jgi:uncharacterized protein YbjT (DUF2867 family)
MNTPAHLRIILTGATGMVGEGVLLTCLTHPEVERVLIVNRRPSLITHPKLQELLVPDFFSLDAVQDKLRGYNACFFCAGVSSVGKSEAEYTRVTHDLTLHFAQTLQPLNPEMTFIYVSGAGTDSSEKGRLMWARVKGRTENELLRIGFRAVYNFRPGFMRHVPGQRNLMASYRYFSWLYPIARVVTPNYVSTLRQVALAMIHTAQRGYPKPILEVRDINSLAAE